MNRRFNGWFSVHMLTYLLLAVMLLGIVGLPVHGIIRNMSRKQLMDSARRGLFALTETLDTLFLEMDSTAYLTQSDGRMIPRLMQENAYYALHAIKDLQRICMTSRYIEDVALYYAPHLFSGGEKIYAGSGIWSKQLFFEYAYRYDQWGMMQIQQELPTYTSPVLRPLEPVLIKNSARVQLMTYVVPLQRSQTNTRGVLLFLLHADAVDKLFEHANLPEDATIVLTDPNQGIIHRFGTSREPDSGYIAGLPPNQSLVEWENIRYHQLTATSVYNGWQYRLILPEATIAATVWPVVRNVLVYLAMALVCAIALSMGLTVYATKPVRKLTDVAKRLMPETPARYTSEFDMIAGTLEHLEQNTLQLTDRLHSQRGVMRMHTLRKLYDGKKEHQAALSNLLKEEGILLGGQFFRVLILLVDDAKGFAERFSPSERDRIRYALVEAGEKTASDLALHAIGCDFGHEPYVALLINADEMKTECLQTLGARLLRIAAIHLHLSMTIGVSKPFASLHTLHLAHQEAMEETDRRFMTGEGNMYFARDEMADSLDTAAWSALEANVLTQLRKQEYDVCRQKIAEYIDHATQCQNPAQARQAMLLLILSIRQALRQAEFTNAVPWNEQLDALLSQRAETITQLQEALDELLDSLSEAQQRLEHSRNNRLAGKAMAYMEANLSNAALNIDLLADHLGVSSGYLSRIFKNQTQTTPMQYLDSLRMKQACALLRNTQLNITELLAACGYVDKTNFIRKFKRLYAITPMAYRSSNAPQEE